MCRHYIRPPRPWAAEFQLMIFKTETDVHQYGEILPSLQAALLQENLFTINIDDIESCNWERQGITLTQKTSMALLEVLPLKKKDLEEAQTMIRQKKSPCWAGPLGLELNLHRSAVKMGNEFIYGGIFLEPTSQRPIDYPVLRVAIGEGRIRFSVLPLHIPFLTYDPGLRDAKTWDDAISAQVKGDWIQFTDDIKQGFSEKGTCSSYTDSFRKLIDDPKIKALMEESGKLLADKASPSKPLPAEKATGVATMRQDGTIVLTLRAKGGEGTVGDAQFVYPPKHPEYKNILKHIGDLQPGMEKPVKPWPEGGK